MKGIRSTEQARREGSFQRRVAAAARRHGVSRQAEGPDGPFPVFRRFRVAERTGSTVVAEALVKPPFDAEAQPYSGGVVTRTFHNVPSDRAASEVSMFFASVATAHRHMVTGMSVQPGSHPASMSPPA